MWLTEETCTYSFLDVLFHDFYQKDNKIVENILHIYIEGMTFTDVTPRILAITQNHQYTLVFIQHLNILIF